MKRQIRHRVYETNSSSTHAICISKEILPQHLIPKSVPFTHGEFGWEFAVYSDVWNKASYLYEAICCVSEDKKEEQEYLSILRESLKRYGVECLFEPVGSGYIDHGYDLYDFVKEVLSNDTKLLSYLFGKSIVVTGNDNSDDFDYYMYTNPDIYPYELKDKFKCYDIYEKGN